MLIDHAVELADARDVRYLELRYKKPIERPAPTHSLTSKVHMRLTLPAAVVELCVVEHQTTPIPAALPVNGRGMSEVIIASSLRSWNSTNANMFMY